MNWRDLQAKRTRFQSSAWDSGQTPHSSRVNSFSKVIKRAAFPLSVPAGFEQLEKGCRRPWLGWDQTAGPDFSIERTPKNWPNTSSFHLQKIKVAVCLCIKKLNITKWKGKMHSKLTTTYFWWQLHQWWDRWCLVLAYLAPFALMLLDISCWFELLLSSIR